MSYYKYTLEELTEHSYEDDNLVRLFGKVLLNWQKP